MTYRKQWYVKDTGTGLYLDVSNSNSGDWGPMEKATVWKSKEILKSFMKNSGVITYGKYLVVEEYWIEKLYRGSSLIED